MRYVKTKPTKLNPPMIKKSWFRIILRENIVEREVCKNINQIKKMCVLIVFVPV